MKRRGMWVAMASILLAIAMLIGWFIHTRGTQYLWFLVLAIAVSGFFAVLPLVVFRPNRQQSLPGPNTQSPQPESPQVVRWKHVTTTSVQQDTEPQTMPSQAQDN